jgi:two-component system sensor histidine kinase RstB
MTSFNGVANRSQRTAELTPESLIEVFFHKLSQPIGTLYGTLELAAMSDDPARHRAAIQSGLQEVEKLNWLFRAMRILFGEDLALGSECIRLSETLNVAIQNCTPLADDRAVRIRCQVQDETWVWANPGYLLQSLENLLARAIKDSGRGGAVQVHLSRQGAESHVSIADHAVWLVEEGAGLFDPFPGSDEGFPERNNLDLCLSRRIIQACGGELCARPTATLTRVFEVTLPVANQQGQ